MNVIEARGLTTKEFESVKKDVKAAVKGFASVRQHKLVGVYGTIDIRPTKRAGYIFNQKQFDAIKQVLSTHRLIENVPGILNTDKEYQVYAKGFDYLAVV